MSQMYGTVDARWGDVWSPVVTVSSLILPNADLNGCLFGVTNYAGFAPLFADRGIPEDMDVELRDDREYFTMQDSHPSWALWSELAQVDWTESTADRDVRISEYNICSDGSEEWASKWVQVPGLDWVRKILDEEPSREIRHEGKIYRRQFMTRSDALDGTEFPLIMKLMACLASRFGDSNVRLFVWFD